MGSGVKTPAGCGAAPHAFGFPISISMLQPTRARIAPCARRQGPPRTLHLGTWAGTIRGGQLQPSGDAAREQGIRIRLPGEPFGGRGVVAYLVVWSGKYFVFT